MADQATRSPAFRILISAPRDVIIGFAQVMLQPSHAVGAAFIAGAFLNDWAMALFGGLGSLSGVLAAIVLRFPEQERKDGLYGFNGALVGLGCSYFYEPSASLAVFVVFGGIASALVMRWMLSRSFRPLTFPFVFVTWIIFAVLGVTGLGEPVQTVSPVDQRVDVLDALLRGVGQVLFQENIITGAIFLIAIAMRNQVEGVFSLAATVIGLSVAWAIGLPLDAINLGLFGYNAVLCGILFSGVTVRSVFSAVAAVILSVAVVRAFHIAELPAFTFPFVLSSWIVLYARGRFAKASRPH